MTKQTLSYQLFETPVGQTGVVWSSAGNPKILKIYLPEKGLLKSIRSEFPDAVAGEPRAAMKIRDLVMKWFEGTDWRFGSNRLTQGCCYEFQKKVLTGTALVKRGKVITYGRLAEKIGDRGAARAVGTALGRNPFPLVIPCHRVVRADGSLGGFGGGLPMKRRLLEMEGVQFDRRGRVKPDYICR